MHRISLLSLKSGDWESKYYSYFSIRIIKKGHKFLRIVSKTGMENEKEMKTQWRIIAAFTLFLWAGLIIAQSPPAVVPNYVKTTSKIIYDTISSPPSYHEQSTVTYSDGFGRTIETQNIVNSSSTAHRVVSGVNFDPWGRTEKTFLPFPESGGFEFISLDQLETKANDFYKIYYPQGDPGDPAAYSQVEYWKEPAERVKRKGAPGKEFCIASGHYVQSWSFGTKENSGNEYFNAEGFFRTEKPLRFAECFRDAAVKERRAQLDTSGLVSADRIIVTANNHLYEYDGVSFTDIPVVNAQIVYVESENKDVVFDADSGMWIDITFIDDHTLNRLEEQGGIFPLDEADMIVSIARDQNGVYSQTISDLRGNTTKTSDPQGNLIAEYEYNAAGKTIKTTPPQGLTPSQTTYTTTGQVLQSTSADAGVKKFKYSSSGQLRFTQNAVQAYLWQNNLGKPVHVYLYDKIGRQTGVSLLDYEGLAATFDQIDGDMDLSSVDPSRFTPCTKTVYDNLQGSEILLDNTSASSIQGSMLRNTKGRVVAVICYNKNYKTGISSYEKVIELYSYDSRGAVKVKYKSIPGIPLQTCTYYYHLSGELYKKIYNNGTTNIPTVYEYDADGRLLHEKDATGNTVVAYQYNDLNELIKKSYFDPHHSGTAQYAIDYTYTISGAVKSISYDNNGLVFNEKMYYARPPEHDPSLYPEEKRNYNGNIGRIEITQSTSDYGSLELNYTYDNMNRLTTVRNGTDENQDDLFDADYTYDTAGRFVKKSEGYEPDGTPVSDKDGYVYQPGSSRLQYITNSQQDKTAQGNDNYIYDPNGNMVLDRSKNMVVVYDWRDMPVVFKFYDIIPDEPFLWNTIGQLDARSDVAMVSCVGMVYDANGSRVAKKVYNP